MILLDNLSEILTLEKAREKGGRQVTEEDLSIIKKGYIVCDEKIIHVGEVEDSFYQDFLQRSDVERHDCFGLVAFPGFIDCHTHPVFGGNRADEFAQKIAGKTYLEISNEGGGIQHSVSHTRSASLEELTHRANETFKHQFSLGITTSEAKSGYGLSVEAELKSLQAIQQASQLHPIEIVPTFLGAHAIPKEFKEKRQQYIDIVCEEMLPAVKEQNLAGIADKFVEDGFYTAEEGKAILQRAKDLGMDTKVHADEFTACGGVELAIEMGSLSADHLECTSLEGMKKLANSKVVAVMLPGTSYYSQLPYTKARDFIENNCIVAVATDFNPGSCVCDNLFFVMNMAAIHMRMKPHEVIVGTTYNAAKAVGLAEKLGTLEKGMQADIALFEIPSYSYLLYHAGRSFIKKVIKKGIPYQITTNYSSPS